VGAPSVAISIKELNLQLPTVAGLVFLLDVGSIASTALNHVIIVAVAALEVVHSIHPLADQN
jgi:hypothetical protein